MSVTERDHSILRHILIYCEQIDFAIIRFGNEIKITGYAGDFDFQFINIYCFTAPFIQGRGSSSPGSRGPGTGFG